MRHARPHTSASTHVRAAALILALAGALALLSASSARATAPGPLGHTWSASLSDYNGNDNPDLTVSQALLQPGGVVSPSANGNGGSSGACVGMGLPQPFHGLTRLWGY